jgi:hypothetical protein
MCWTPEMWARRDRLYRLIQKLKQMPGTNMDLKREVHRRLLAQLDAIGRPSPRRAC